MPTDETFGDDPPVGRVELAELVAIGVGLVAGLAALSAGAQPTGEAVIDVLLVVASVGFVVWAAASAPWWAVTAAAGIAVAVALDPWAALLAGAGFALGLAMGVRRWEPGWARAVVAGLALNGLIRSDLAGFLGLSAIVGVTVGAMLLVIGLVGRPAPVRRVGWTVVVTSATIGVIAVVVTGLVAMSVRSDLTAANQQARGAIDRLNDGGYEEAADGFEAAAESFGAVERRLDGPFGQLAFLLPAVAQNVAAGADLAEAADGALGDVAAALREVDPDSLRVIDGAIDVDAVRAVEAPLTRVQDSLVALRRTTEDVASPWLLGRVQQELDELAAEFDENEPRLQNAVDAVRLAPGILGADGERRYLVLFTSPVEARGIAGFIGNYALVEIDAGRVEVSEFGRRTDLQAATNAGGARCTVCSEELFDRYGRFGFDRGDGVFGANAWTALTLPAHFPYVGEAARDLFRQGAGDPIDGVISIDPHVVATLMQYTGPIELAEVGVTVEPDNAAEFLLRGQYDLIDDASNDERIETIDTLGQQVIRELLSGSLPEPSRLAEDLSPLVGEDRLLAWSAVPEEQALFDRIGMAGALPSLDDDGGFGVVVANAGHSKIDVFLERDVAVAVEQRGDDRVLVADVSLTNTAPRRGLPTFVIGNEYGLPVGTSWLWVNFYGPDTLIGATLDGEPIELNVGTEAGWTVHDTYVVLGSGERATFRLEFALPGDGIGGGGPVLWTQPLAAR